MKFAEVLRNQNKKFGLANADKSYGKSSELEQKLLMNQHDKPRVTIHHDSASSHHTAQRHSHPVNLSQLNNTKLKDEPYATILSKRNLEHLPR